MDKKIIKPNSAKEAVIDYTNMPKKLSKEEIEAAIKKATQKPKSTFDQFKKIVMIIVFFSEKMDLEEINECLQDWYVLYKEAGDYGIVEYMKQHLQDVNRNSHDFWLDERGLL
jgi:hypothetical protein